MKREDLLLEYEDLIGYTSDEFNSRDWKEFEEFISNSKTYTKKEVDALIEKYEKDMSFYGRDYYYNIEEAKNNWKSDNL